MKTRTTSFIAAGAILLSVSAAARADGGVTLYGLIDTGFEYLSGLPQGNLLHAESGYAFPSRWGLRGTEDIGAGTKVVFRLEAGFSTTTGGINNGSFFGRNATVGMSNPRWGQWRVGNFGITEMAQDSFDVDPQWMQPYSIVTLVRGRNWSQAGNGIEYTTPSMHGLTLKGQYDLGNSTHWNEGASGPNQLGEFTQGRSDAIGATYEGGPVLLMAIYDEIRDGNGQFDNVYVNSRSLLLGGSLQEGPVRFYAGYQHLSAPGASNAGMFANGVPTALPPGATLPTQVDHEWLGVQWQATSADSLTAAVYHSNANHGNGNATLYTLGGTHNLSKRTFLYAEAAYLRNSATSNIGLGDGFSDPYGANVRDDPASNSTSTAPDYGQSQQGVFAGIVHKF